MVCDCGTLWTILFCFESLTFQLAIMDGIINTYPECLRLMYNYVDINVNLNAAGTSWLFKREAMTV